MKQRIVRLGWLLLLGSSSPASAQPTEPSPTEPPAEAAAPPAAAEAEAAAPVSEQTALAAETEAAAETATVEERDDDIVVTGTRVKQTSFVQSAPVEVISRKQLEQSGVSNLAEVVQFLTVAQGTSSGTGLGSALGSTGAAINLRGLGAVATLLLVNGRRLNPSGNPGFPSDMTIIPLAAVERIEILKAGAAAIYGADAVGGVVNVVTRRAWTGFRLQLDGQTTQNFDHGEYTASSSFGAVTDRSRILVAASYLRRSELTTTERDELTRGVFITNQGHPGAFITEMLRIMPDPDCGRDLPLRSAAGESMSMMVPMANGVGCSDDYRPYSTLIGAAERANAFASGEFDLNDNVTVFGELVLSRFRGSSIVPIFGVLPPYPLVPADHVDNPFGVDVRWMGRPRGGREHTEPQKLTGADDSFRGVFGVKGDFQNVVEGLFEDWSWELYASVGVSRYRRTLNDNLRYPLQMALDSCSDPADLSACFNPFYSAVTGAGTANAQEVIDSFAGRQAEIADHSLQTYNAGLDGTLFALPGGEVGIALGAELRREWRGSEQDHDYREAEYGFLGGTSDQAAKRNVYSGYLELRWPFYKGIELQTAGRVERYTDTQSTPISPFAGLTLIPADIVGADNVPSALRRLQVRANASTAFRAPTIFQTYPGLVTTATPLVRRGGSIATWIPVTNSGNPDLDAETAYTLSGGFVWTPIDHLNLMSEVWYYDYKDRIQPEIAAQILAMWEATGGYEGLNMDPRVVYAPLTDTVGPVYTTNINVEGSVITSGLDFGATFDFGRDGAGGFGNISVSAQGTYTFSYTIPRRETTIRAFTGTDPMTGMPMAMRLGPKACSGSAGVDLDMDPNNNTLNDQDRCDVAGSRNWNNIAPPVPRLKMNIPLVWTLKGHSASLVGHYISGYDDDVQPRGDGSLDEIPPLLTLDVQYGYTLADVIGNRLTVRVGCENLLNQMPPRVNGASQSFDVETHDPRGRMFFAKLSAEF